MLTFTGDLSPSPVPTASLKSRGEEATPPPHPPPAEQQQVLNVAAETPASQVEGGNTQQSSGEGDESPPLEDRGESNTQQKNTKGTVQHPNGDAAPPSVNDFQEQAPQSGDSGQNQNSLENHQGGETG